jgi:hypothetical protein
MSARRRIAVTICAVYAPPVYISVWLISVTSTPRRSSDSRSGSLKCSAQLSCAPQGSGTELSGRPTYSANSSPKPTGTRRKRS